MAQDLDKLLDRVTAHYQPIADLGTGAVAGFEALARIAEDGGPARSIGPFIEEIERDPAHLERLMRQILAAVQRDADRRTPLNVAKVLRPHKLKHFNRALRSGTLLTFQSSSRSMRS